MTVLTLRLALRNQHNVSGYNVVVTGIVREFVSVRSCTSPAARLCFRSLPPWQDQLHALYCTRYGPFIVPAPCPLLYQIRAFYCTSSMPFIVPDSCPLLYQIRALYCTRYWPFILPDTGPLLYQIGALYSTRYGPFILPDTPVLFIVSK